MSLVILDEKGEIKMEKKKVAIKDRAEVYILLLIAIVFLWGLIFATTGRSAEISTNSFGPPKGNCKQGEVYRCIMGTCFSSLLYCPPVYEDGKLISDTNCNTTTCSWDCECVEKKAESEANQVWTIKDSDPQLILTPASESSVIYLLDHVAY